MIGHNLELENKMNDFIKYCQKHSIDKYIIDKYKYDANVLPNPNMNVFVSNNYVYCSYTYDERIYIFKFKDVEALLAFDNFAHEMDYEYLWLGSIYTIEHDYKFDYENNETTTIINGHCLKSYIKDALLYRYSIDTIDNDTCLILMNESIKSVVINSNMQTVLGKLSKFNNSDIWVSFKTIPEELKNLVNLQKVMLTMIGE